ncbi:MAG: prepilin-type N-terminal cleavage/methylation domain-containing protein [Candidatus Sumerlaeia bacterium]|nr:prepilin-type N-terminal cleavage/methylation domain-containing protein [Candidatus Sumerlaeia bacterium]
MAKAFTLIELIIVVAIIAILSAIAVPNFLEAQTRSKLARVRADFRAKATAMEAYAVDNNRYPIPSNALGEFIQNPRTDNTVSPFETKTAILLTTPIAYMSSRATDPFVKARNSVEPPLYHSITRDMVVLKSQTSSVNWLIYWTVFFRETFDGKPNPPAVSYWFQSFGPDQDHDTNVPHAPGGPNLGPHVHGNGAIYDPTNGTISNGDLHYFGPGYGFSIQ